MDLEDVLGLKDSAKSSRDKGRWSEALTDLRDALDLLHAMDSGSEDVTSEIADTYGMIGGIERRWALTTDGPDRAKHLERSQLAYDQGFEREDRIRAEEGTTYNRINRLIARVLIDPSILAGEQGDLDIRRELAVAESLVAEQTDGERKRDPWAYCDLLMIQLLSDGQEAASTLNVLVGLHPPDFVYRSLLDTLEPLSAAASSVRPQLDLTVQRLRQMAAQPPAG